MKRLIFILILFLAAIRVEASISLSLEEPDCNFFAKEEIKRTIFICNESLETKDIVVRWKTSVFSAVLQKGKEKLELRELQGKELQFILEMPEVKQRSPLVFKLQIINDAKLELEKEWNYFVFPKNISDTLKNILKDKEVGVFDSSGKIKQIFNEFGISFTPLTNQLSIGAFQGDLIITGSEEDSRQMLNIFPIFENKVTEGISVISFREEMDTEDRLPVPLTNISPLPLDIKNITILSPNHPLFTGLTEDDFNNWRKNGIVTRFPLIKPVKGNFRVLAETDLSTTPFSEIISGKGKFILCQLSVIDKFQEEPIAQALFANLLRYTLFVEQEALQPALVYGNTETGTMKTLNSLSVVRDTLGESNIIILCLDENSKEVTKKKTTPIPSHIKEIIEKGGVILMFATFPDAVDFLGIKENIKRMKIAPTGQQRIYYRHEEIIALGRKSSLLMGMNEEESDLLMKRGKIYKLQLGNADIIVCQSLFDEHEPLSLRAMSQLLTNLGIKIEKEVINEEPNLEL